MSSPFDRLRAELPPRWKFEPGPATDYIDMEFILRDLDPPVRSRVVAARLDAIAKVHANMAEMHKNIADGAGNISKILAGKTGK